MSNNITLLPGKNKWRSFSVKLTFILGQFYFALWIWASPRAIWPTAFLFFSLGDVFILCAIVFGGAIERRAYTIQFLEEEVIFSRLISKGIRIPFRQVIRASETNAGLYLFLENGRHFLISSQLTNYAEARGSLIASGKAVPLETETWRARLDAYRASAKLVSHALLVFFLLYFGAFGAEMRGNLLETAVFSGKVPLVRALIVLKTDLNRRLVRQALSVSLWLVICQSRSGHDARYT